MKTFKQIVEKFQAAATYHTYIQSFGFGSLDNLNNMINQGYPLMWLRPLQFYRCTTLWTKNIIFRGIHSYSSKTNRC